MFSLFSLFSLLLKYKIVFKNMNQVGPNVLCVLYIFLEQKKKKQETKRILCVFLVLLVFQNKK